MVRLGTAWLWSKAGGCEKPQENPGNGLLRAFRAVAAFRAIAAFKAVAAFRAVGDLRAVGSFRAVF